jgi:hypothetical protein
VKLIALIFLLSTLSAQAKDNKLQQDEFLRGVESGRIVLDKAKLFNVPGPVIEKMGELQKKKYPLFQNNMLYVNFVQTTDWVYTIFYDWTGDKCVYRSEQIDHKLGKPNEKTLDALGTEIAMRYCIKLYKIGSN